MTTPRRSQLFHAIVVAGVGLAGGCSRSLVNATDASVDGSADLATDLGGAGDRFDAGKDSTSTDVSPGDAVCVCKDDGGDSCRQCTCGCFMPGPGDGGVCFPCYV